MTDAGEPAKSEEELDEEAVERFDGESIAPTPEPGTSANDQMASDADLGKSDNRQGWMRSLFSKPAIGAAVGLVAAVVAGVLFRKKRSRLGEQEQAERSHRQRIIDAAKHKARPRRTPRTSEHVPSSFPARICRTRFGRAKSRR